LSALPDDATGLLAAYGLMPRGALRFDPGEEAPIGPGGKPARAVVLVGHAGSSFWPHFRQWRETRPQLGDPLDAWSREVISAVACTLGAAAVFPFDRPYLPFQQWAMRAEGLKPSPLGMLIHPRYGLWHAWRGALLFTDEISIEEVRNPIHPCDDCVAKPCLSTCPVNAISGEGFAVAACRSYLESSVSSHADSTARTGPDCMGAGCAARNSCPVGAQYRYGAEQIRFHMRAFAG
jgi:ferredoxin